MTTKRDEYGFPENLPTTFICSHCGQEVDINQEGDPRLEYGMMVDCPNCGTVSKLSHE
jgi:DNA-directed RNA polymerase subunit RPC12/RpoP